MHPIYVLEENESNYDKIIHFSDIHIRTGDPEKARYSEYSTVFQNLVESLSTKDLSSTIIVITGDLFHHKGKIETAGIKLVNQLFQKLLNLAPTFVLCGNHDYRQDDPEIPDMIEALLEMHHKKLSSQKYPLYYLNKSGVYVYNNISFGVVDIRDALKSYNTFGRNEELITFPSCESTQTEYKVALFHGYVAPKDLCEKYKNMNSYPLEWFGTEYPFILLGDIHRQQIHKTTQGQWGYPGSLIQQDFGERVMDHGYLEWDLKKQKVHFHRVYNPYGFCTLKKHMNQWYVHSHQKEWYELNPISQNEFFPKKPMVRVLNQDEQECKEVLNQYGIQAKRIQRSVMEVEDLQDESLQESVATNLEELNTPDKWIDFLNHTVQKDYSIFIRQPENLKLPSICDFLKKYHDRNDKIQKVIDEYMGHQIGTVKQAQRVELVNMSWNYLMCYGDNNYFDFTKIKNQIALLNGKNAMGKSSFLDVLCIGLYGTPTKMRSLVTAKKYTDKIIHDHRPTHKVAPSVTILLRIKDSYYEIHRVFGSQSGKDKEHMIMQKEVSISKIPLDFSTKQIICEGNTTVETWIEKNIGNMDSVLMSTMICQMDLNNFFHMKQEDQKAILDTALHLENVSLFGKILRESLLAHQDLMGQLKTAMDTVTAMATPIKENEMKQIQQAYDIAKERYEKQSTLKEYWLTKVKTKNWQTLVISDTIEEDYRKAKDEYEFEFHEEKYQSLTSRLETSIRLEEKLKATKEALEPYENAPLYKESEKHLARWEKKKQQFLEQKPKSEVSLDWIMGTREKYDRWTKSQSPEWLADPDLIEEDVKFLFDKEEDNESKLGELCRNSIAKPTSTRPSKLQMVTFSDFEYDKCNEKLQVLLQTEPKPQLTLEEYDKWMEQYEEWYEKNEEFLTWKDDQKVQKKLQSVLDKIQQHKARQEELQDTMKDLLNTEKDLEFYKDLQFNPKCKACVNNPFNLKKQDLEHNQQELIDYCKKLQNYISKLNDSKTLVELESQKDHYTQKLEAFKQYKLEKNYYEKEYQKWTQIKDQFDAYEEWKGEYDKVMEEKKQLDQCKVHYDWKQYEQWKIDLMVTQQRQAELHETKRVKQTFLKEYEEWQETLKTLTTQEEQYQLLQVWLEEEKVIEQKLNQFQQSIKKQTLLEAYTLYEKQYVEVKEELTELKRLTEIKEHFQKMENLYASYKLQTQYTSLQEAKEQLEKAYQIYIESKQTYDLQKEYQAKRKQYEEISLQLQERYDAIKELETYFMGDKNSTDGYKEWIYKHKVIPLVNQEMNQFLSLFEDFRFKMIYDKKQLLYMLEDRGNQPTLDKSSGYQNFIISIAFRIIFSRIGAIGQQFKHLIIDEGFTACDNINIEKVPILLKSILEYGKYHSIIVMSHLDSVRDCTNKMIQIERQDPFSYIRYGNLYPVISTTTTPEGKVLKKGRGRPKTSV